MASPQLENGYTRISNELLEEIFQRDFNGSQLRTLLCLIRNTYGYGRRECSFSTGFVMKALGSDKKNISVVLKSLIESKVMIVEKEATYTGARVLSLNKNYDEWKIKVPQWGNIPTVGQITNRGANNQQGANIPSPTVGDIANGGVGDVTNQKRKILKKDIKENIYDDFFEQIWKLYPRKLGKSAVTKKAKKELYQAGMEEVASAIKKYSRESDCKDEQYILHGSTFFNGRWKDYLTAANENEPPRPVFEEPEEPVLDLWTEEGEQNAV